MDVLVIDNDSWWRNHIVRDLSRAGHRCHPYAHEAYTPDALLAWRSELALEGCAAIVDIILDTDYDERGRRASFDAVARWGEAGWVTSPLFFISGSAAASWERRRLKTLGGIELVKDEVRSWARLLES